jgi:transposase
MTNYSTNLTDIQWQVIKNILNGKERKQKYDLREIMNAITSVS